MEGRGIKSQNRRIRNEINRFVLIFTFAVLLLIGCKSVKKVGFGEGDSGISYNALIQNLNNNVGKFDAVYYPKVRFTVTQNGSKNQFTGTLSIKKDEEIFATVNAFLGIEVARVLLNKDSVVIKSNFERKLYILDYKQMIKKFGLSGDFSTIENVLCYQLAMYKANLYDYQQLNKEYLITPKDRIKSKVDYDHLTAAFIDNSYKITNITYCAKAVNDCLNVTYNNFTSQNKFINPGFIQVANDKQDVNLEMVMGKASYDGKYDHKLGSISNFEVVRY